MRASADSAAERINLLLSLSCFCTACWTFGQIEARQDLDDVQPRHRILALDPRDQIVDGGFVGDFADDLEQPGSLGGLLGIGRVQQFAHRDSGPFAPQSHRGSPVSASPPC